ncbi:hypothetical protein [Sorangium sp. So ce1153]|uniref:hypothetical protein n=1 Tax=Sorangium sp. So ce1153 TaxID=3133333 RepID=UPI003F634921
MSRSRVRLREALRAPVQTTDPAGLAAYAKHLRPVVATLRSLAEDATAARPMYSREYLREEMLKGIRVLEARLDAAASPEPAPKTEHGDSDSNSASPVL